MYLIHVSTPQGGAGFLAHSGVLESNPAADMVSVYGDKERNRAILAALDYERAHPGFAVLVLEVVEG